MQHILILSILCAFPLVPWARNVVVPSMPASPYSVSVKMARDYTAKEFNVTAAAFFVRIEGDSMIGKIFSAAEGIQREWKMKRSLLSKRAMTSWEDLLVVK